MIRLLIIASSLSVAYLVARYLSKGTVPEPYFPGPTFVYTSGTPDDSYPWPIGI